jgi:hypothetical protein
MDHDRLFKELLTNFFFEFIELFVPQMAAEMIGRASSFWIRKYSVIHPRVIGVKLICSSKFA